MSPASFLPSGLRSLAIFLPCSVCFSRALCVATCLSRSSLQSVSCTHCLVASTLANLGSPSMALRASLYNESSFFLCRCVSL
uniref:Putative secreted protein n=1 Tax=Ixodes ricinus TaxID=34613 RepID=A0A6B0U624_IXORI